VQTVDRIDHKPKRDDKLKTHKQPVAELLFKTTRCTVLHKPAAL